MSAAAGVEESVRRNLENVRARIARACAQAGRPPESVRLLAVSKTFPAEMVRAAHAAGQRAFGENYVQEGVAKVAALRERLGDDALEWHFIGPLQSNKTREVAEHFDWVHGVGRLKIAERLSAQRPGGRAPLQLCIQVNISGEASKSGIAAEQVPALARAVAALPRVRLRGLMAIPEPVADTEAQRFPHRRLKALLDRLNADGLKLDTLSIGMSDDLEAAILEGSTLVRVGTAIFGSRKPTP